MTRTVTVRIPLVIDAEGRWFARSDSFRAGNFPGWVGDYYVPNGTHHWITAEVSVPASAPAPTEIAGRAEPAEPSHD